MNILTVYDMVMLQEYFTRKKEPSTREKLAADKVNEHLIRIVEGMEARTWKAEP